MHKNTPIINVKLSEMQTTGELFLAMSLPVGDTTVVDCSLCSVELDLFPSDTLVADLYHCEI